MEQPRGHLLADARAAHHQDAAAGRSNPFQGRTDAVDRGGAARQIVVAADRRPQRGDFAPQPLGFRGAGDHQQQALGLEGLFDEVGCAAPDRGDRGVEIAMTGDHQDRDRRIAALDLVEQFEAVEARSLQPHVEQHQRRTARRDRVERGVAVRGSARSIAFVLEHPGDQVADVMLVVDDEDIECHGSGPMLGKC